MPYLEKIVGLINMKLQGGSLSDVRFAAAQIYGIAMNVTRDKVTGGGKETLPTVWQPTGDPQYIGIDDTAPLIIYHKVTKSLTIPEPADRQFGNGQRRVRNTALLFMVVYADRSRITLAPDELEAAIEAGMPDEIAKADFPSKGFSSMVVQPADANFNSGAIFSQEYPGADNFLKPESILFQVSYSIVSVFQKDCLAICGC